MGSSSLTHSSNPFYYCKSVYFNIDDSNIAKNITNSWNFSDIGRNCLLGHRKKIAKFLMRSFTYRSTFLYVQYIGPKLRPSVPSSMFTTLKIKRNMTREENTESRAAGKREARAAGRLKGWPISSWRLWATPAVIPATGTPQRTKWWAEHEIFLPPSVSPTLFNIFWPEWPKVSAAE